MEIAQFLTTYGPYVGLALYVAVKEVLPWLRDKVYPEYAERKKVEASAFADALAQQRIAATAREDRLFGILEQTVGTLTKIESTMDQMQDTMGSLTSELKRHADVLHTVNMDIAGLYGSVGHTRPSRRSKEQE